MSDRRPSCRMSGLLVCAIVASATPAHAAGFPGASSPPPAHLVINGYGVTRANGDWVTSHFHGTYYFRIEVTPGTTKLNVDIWDADLGKGADEGGTIGPRDERAGDYYLSSFDYTLAQPDGTTVSTFNALDLDATYDNQWRTLWSVDNPAPGHWELRVKAQNSAYSDDDFNAFAVRANDGDPAAGGRELNLYVPGILPLGTNKVDASSWTFFPYVVSGCSCTSNDFDSDADSASSGYTLAARTGTPSWGPFTPSLNDAWARGIASGFASAANATGYGLWTGSKTKPQGKANVYNYYVGNSTEPALPPTANPPADSVRIYAPTDGGVKPVKPYFEQVARYKSGANPPAQGQSTTLRVTVYVVNPTLYAITFSLTNLVRTEVPTLRTRYGGNASWTQGTIVAQPSAGATGAITWNPGSVAAGTTASLSYDVVVTPTASGELTYLTPQPTYPPSTTSTAATFLDETGAATTTLGPLCPLSITAGTRPTLAVVAAFSAKTGAGGTKVVWSTAAEDGTAGFVLERQRPGEPDFSPVHEGLLAAPFGALVGSRWEVPDLDVTSGQKATYRLVEIEAGGARRVYGPWGNEDAAEEDLTLVDDSLPFATPHPRDERAKPVASEPIAQEELQLALAEWPALKVETEEPGLHLVPVETIASALGLTPSAAAALVRAGRLELTNQGRAVPWTRTTGADGVVFWAEALEDAYAPRNVFLLRQGRGEVMGTASSAHAFDRRSIRTAPETLHVERDALALTLFPVDPDSDYWYWEALQANHPSEGRKRLAFEAPGVAGGAARLTVHLAGGSTTKAAGEHHLLATLDGGPSAEVRFEGTGAAQLVMDLPAGVLREGENVLELTAILEKGVSSSTVLVDSVDLQYERRTEAQRSAHVVRPARSGTVEVTGLAEGELFVLDVSDPARPRVVAGARITRSERLPGQVDASFGAVGGRRYAVATRAGLLRPAAFGRDRSAELLASRSADWIALTTAALAPAVLELAEHRASRGISTRVVDVDAVYDAFGHGLKTPKALRAFLSRLAEDERTRPRWVLLAGAGDFDFKGRYGLGGNELPPLMVSTPAGLLASDNALVDFDDDGAPDLTVGRLPVRSRQELDAYLEKVVAHERTASPDQPERALLLSDNREGGIDFAADAQSLVPAFPPDWSPERHSVGAAPLDAVRASLLASFRSGAGAVVYFGHGGFDRLAAEGLLTSADLPSLSTPTYPVLAGLACFIGRFDIPGHTSLGQRLVVTEGRGSAAVWAGAGWSDPVEASALARDFGRIAFTNRSATLGDAIRGAFDAHRARGGTAETMLTYVLLGDPALTLRAPGEPPAADSEGTR